MGLKDRMQQVGEKVQAASESYQAHADERSAAKHYEVTVNKNDLNVGRMTDTLNQRWAQGWRLAHVLEQAGNTVMVFERRD